MCDLRRYPRGFRRKLEPMATDIHRIAFRVTLPLLIAAMLAFPAWSQTKTVATFDGDFAAGWFGYAVDSAGDVNGDGVPDVIAGSPAASNFGGRARLLSGKTGVQLFPFPTSFSSSAFGGAVAGLGDVNADGTPDVAIGVFYLSSVSKNYCRVHSGLDGSLIHHVQGVDGKGLGTALSSIGDMNADGRNDFLVGISSADDVFPLGGLARVYFGLNATVLWTATPDVAGEFMGRGVAGVGDVNLDGTPDFAVGAPSANPPVGSAAAGAVHIYSGSAGTRLFTVGGLTPGEEFGSAVAGGGDINGDGVPDFAVGAYLANNNSGRAQFFSGANGASLKAVKGAAAEGFGFSLAIVGDVNGDGRAEVLVGSPNAARAKLFSGATGSPIATIQGTKDDGTGTGVGRAGDMDGDGIPEFLVGSPYADVGGSGNSPGLARAYGFTGAPASAKRKIALQRLLSGVDPDAAGALEFSAAKGGQSIKITATKLSVNSADVYQAFLETGPASGVYELLATLSLSNAKTGSWGATRTFAGSPFDVLGVPFLIQLAGRRIELRNGASQVILAAELPPIAAVALKISVALGAKPAAPAGSSGVGLFDFNASQGTHKISITTKSLIKDAAYDLYIEDGPTVGTFTLVAPLIKGKLTIDTKSGAPLPLGALSFATFKGRILQIRQGATVILEGTIP